MKLNKFFQLILIIQSIAIVPTFKTFAHTQRSEELNQENSDEETPPPLVRQRTVVLTRTGEIFLRLITAVYEESEVGSWPRVVVKYFPLLRKLEIIPMLNSMSHQSFYFDVNESYGRGSLAQVQQGIISQNQSRINKAITLIDSNGDQREFFYENGRATQAVPFDIPSSEI